MLALWLAVSWSAHGQQVPFQCPVQPLPASQAQPMQRGAAPLTICPDVQNIRVNVHFVQYDDGSGNFAAFNDGKPCNPSTTTTGYEYAQGLIGYANDNMNQNANLNLPPGNSISPMPPKRIRWVLDGVYFDRNTFLRQGVGANSTPTNDYTPLCVNADSVINIFLTEEFASPYNAGSCILPPNPPAPTNRGFVFASNQADCNNQPAPAKLWATVGSPWANYVLNRSAIWEMARNVNHELGHLLGLNHPFQGISTCADAPASANCWNLNSADPNCDMISKVSTNLMDYNAHQSSLSPCQIGIAQDNLNSCLQSRYVYKCDNCLPTRANFSLFFGDGVNTPSYGLYLDGRAAFNHQSFKIEIDEVLSAPFSGLGKHYEQMYNRQVGLEDLANSHYNFRAGSTYQITLRTYNNCGSAAVHVETIYYAGGIR